MTRGEVGLRPAHVAHGQSRMPWVKSWWGTRTVDGIAGPLTWTALWS